MGGPTTFLPRMFSLLFFSTQFCAPPPARLPALPQARPGGGAIIAITHTPSLTSLTKTCPTFPLGVTSRQTEILMSVASTRRGQPLVWRMTYIHQCEIASMKVSCTLHFAVPTQRAQYPPNHPWNGRRCSQVLVWRLGGAQALGCMASDDASQTMLLEIGR